MVAMSSAANGGIVGKKFSFGTGPKPVVEKINRYFNSTNSISLALNKLLDRFEKSAFVYYTPPEQGELVELSKNILYGKPGDDLNSIKTAFTRLSVTLKENETYKRFGNEAPILLLDHMLSPKAPPEMTRPKYMSMLGLKPKREKRRSRDPTSEKFRQKDSPNLSLEMSQRLGIQGVIAPKVDPSATMIPGSRPIYRGLVSSSTSKFKRKANNLIDSPKRKKIIL